MLSVPGRPQGEFSILAPLLVVMLPIAYLGAQRPLVFVSVCGLLVVLWAAVASYRNPRVALRAAPLLIVLAGTKFRYRDASASLAHQLDTQTAFELGVYGILGASLLMILASGAVRAPNISVLDYLLLAFVLFAVFSVSWSGAPIISAVRAVQAAIIFAVAFLSVHILGHQALLRILGVTLTAFVLVFSSLVAIFPRFRLYTYEDRFAWFAVHPISSATLTAIALLFVLAVAISDDYNRRRMFRVPVPIVALPLVAVLLLTRSRGPLVAAVAAVVALVAVRYLRRWQAPALIGLAAICGLIFATVGTPLKQLLARGAASGNPILAFFFREQTAEQLSSFTGRIDLWKTVLGIVSARPFHGYGYHGSRGLLLDEYSWAGYAHNAFLQTLLDLGVIGTGLLWSCIVAALVMGLKWSVSHVKDRWEDRFAMAALVFLVVNSVTSESFAAAPGIELLLLFTCIMCIAGKHGAPAAVQHSLNDSPLGLRARVHPAAA